jgi:hypothetical protein
MERAMAANDRQQTGEHGRRSAHVHVRQSTGATAKTLWLHQTSCGRYKCQEVGVNYNVLVVSFGAQGAESRRVWDRKNESDALTLLPTDCGLDRWEGFLFANIRSHEVSNHLTSPPALTASTSDSALPSSRVVASSSSTLQNSDLCPSVASSCDISERERGKSCLNLSLTQSESSPASSATVALIRLFQRLVSPTWTGSPVAPVVRRTGYRSRCRRRGCGGACAASDQELVLRERMCFGSWFS